MKGANEEPESEFAVDTLNGLPEDELKHLETKLFEVHDMQPYDPTQEIIFPPELKVRWHTSV